MKQDPFKKLNYWKKRVRDNLTKKIYRQDFEKVEEFLRGCDLSTDQKKIDKAIKDVIKAQDKLFKLLGIEKGDIK